MIHERERCPIPDLKSFGLKLQDLDDDSVTSKPRLVLEVNRVDIFLP